LQALPRQVAVVSERRKSFPVDQVLALEVVYQRALARPGLADDVHVGPAVGALDAKTPPLVAEVGFGEGGDWPLALLDSHARERHEASLQKEARPARRAKWPKWIGVVDLHYVGRTAEASVVIKGIWLVA